MTERRLRVFIDKEDRQKVREISRRKGILMPKAYAECLSVGVDTIDEENSCLDLIKDEYLEDKGVSFITIDFSGQLYRKVKHFSTKNNLRRPVAYYILIKKGLQILLD